MRWSEERYSGDVHKAELLCTKESHCKSPLHVHVDKDVLRTDQDHPLFNDPDSPKLVQLEDILKTYVMYNFDLGNSE